MQKERTNPLHPDQKSLETTDKDSLTYKNILLRLQILQAYKNIEDLELSLKQLQQENTHLDSEVHLDTPYPRLPDFTDDNSFLSTLHSAISGFRQTNSKSSSFFSIFS